MAKLETSLDEMLDILSLFKNDLSDSEYERARTFVISKGALIMDGFNAAVETQDPSAVVEFFRAI